MTKCGQLMLYKRFHLERSAFYPTTNKDRLIEGAREWERERERGIPVWSQWQIGRQRTYMQWMVHLAFCLAPLESSADSSWQVYNNNNIIGTQPPLLMVSKVYDCTHSPSHRLIHWSIYLSSISSIFAVNGYSLLYTKSSAVALAVVFLQIGKNNSSSTRLVCFMMRPT